jgi:hypothetical protein
MNPMIVLSGDIKKGDVISVAKRRIGMSGWQGCMSAQKSALNYLEEDVCFD